MGSSTYFGTAIDEAIMAMLDKNPNYMDLFHQQWKYSKNMFGKTTPVFDNPEIIFGHADFDKHILKPEDRVQLETWANELGLELKTVKENVGEDDDGLLITKERKETVEDLYVTVSKAKKNPYKRPSKAQLTYFNRASWLSMQRKGELLIEAFRVQFLPKVKKVLATQLRASITSDDGEDQIGGLLDFVVELEGYDKPVIMDLKTAGKPYTQESIDLTEQLVLYYALKGQEYNTNLVGYVVLCKNIPKLIEAKCALCGHERDGRHKKCNNEIGDKRCNGEWIEVVKTNPEVQVLIQSKNDQDKHNVFVDYSNILFAMKKDIVYKNTDKCLNWFGGICPFFDLCHKGDDSKLKKRT